MQDQSDKNSPTPSEAFLSALVGRPIVVHTITGGHEAPARFGVAQAAVLYGQLEANYPDALVLEIAEQGQPGGRVLIYKRAIVAVEARGTTTP
jgi:hypothetical protein